MTLEEICNHERAGMFTRRTLGYAQYDDHIWRWLNYHLAMWNKANPIRIV